MFDSMTRDKDELDPDIVIDLHGKTVKEAREITEEFLQDRQTGMLIICWSLNCMHQLIHNLTLFAPYWQASIHGCLRINGSETIWVKFLTDGSLSFSFLPR